jgi:hypothetical protein
MKYPFPDPQCVGAFSTGYDFFYSSMKLFSQVTADSRYQIVKTAELHSSAEDFPEEKHIMDLATQIEKPQLPSENDIKRFDVVVDCSDHHFVKEGGHENVILYLIQLYLFIFNL